MATEFEAKALDIDPAETTRRILAAGGRQTGPADALMRRYVYDITPGDQSRWLRDTGGEVTLTVKAIAHDDIDGTQEWETTVGDSAATAALFEQLGFRPKSYQENTRTSYVLGAARLEIDQWPRIPPYLEIEGDTRAHVVATAELLGFDESALTGENTVKVHARHGLDLSAIPELRFTGPT